MDAVNRSSSFIEPIQVASKAPPILEKIKKIVRKIFEFLTFPLRYLGAKNWSIPGLILRTPILLFRRIFFNEPLTKAQFFGTGYHHSSGPQLSKQETKEVLRYAAYGLVPFRYDQEKWAFPFGGKIIPPVDLHVDVSKLPGHVQATEHAFFDKTNLFKAVVLEDAHELVVTFGALHSHWPEFANPKEAKAKAYKPLPSILSNYVGCSPKQYKQADALVAQLKKLAQAKGKRLVLTGQSLGGSLASYAALKHEVKAIAFNAVQFGAGLQHQIGDAKLAQADKYLTQISVDNDLLNNLPGSTAVDHLFSRLGVRTPGTFGKRYRIPTAFKKMREAHDFPIQCMMKYIGYEQHTKANQLKPEDIFASR